MSSVSIPIFDVQGGKASEIAVDPAIFDKAVRKPLLKEALIAYLASQRQGTHKTKNRGEIAGGGKKPWRQKGTGRARQGSARAPQWVGGGHAHAIKPRDYGYQLPAAQRRLALLSSLRYRLESSSMCAVEGLDGAVALKPSTRTVAKLLEKLGLSAKGALLVSEGNVPNLWLSVRNIPKVSVSERRCLNAGAILTHSRLVFSKNALEALLKELKG